MSPGADILWGYVGDDTAGSRFAGTIGSSTGEPNLLRGQVIVAPYNP